MRNVTGRNESVEQRTQLFGGVAPSSLPSKAAIRTNDSTSAHADGHIPSGWATSWETTNSSPTSWPQPRNEVRHSGVMNRSASSRSRPFFTTVMGTCLVVTPYSSIRSTRNETGRKPSLQQGIAVPGFAIQGRFEPKRTIATSRWMSTHAQSQGKSAGFAGNPSTT